MATIGWGAGATLAGRALLALTFGLAGLSGLLAPGTFRESVTSYHLLPPDLVPIVATALPWAELLLALYFACGLFLRLATIAGGAVVLAFGAAMATNLIQGRTASGCGCDPETGPVASLRLIQWVAGRHTKSLLDLALAACALVVLALVVRGDHRFLSVDGWLARGGEHTDHGASAGGDRSLPAGQQP